MLQPENPCEVVPKSGSRVDDNHVADDVHDLYSRAVTAVADRSRVLRTPPCEVCCSETARPQFAIEQTPFAIVVCTECGLGSLLPRPTAGEIPSFYPQNYYGDSGTKFSGLIEPFVRLIGTRRARFVARLIRPGGRVLDVGCGRGITLRAVADAGCEAHGFEVSSHALRGVDPRVKTTVASSLVEAAYPDSYFDGVLVWHVLEHVPDPRRVVGEAWRILQPGGVLIVAVPNFSSIQSRWAGAAWFHLDPPRHLFHFPAAALEQLADGLGFATLSRHHFSLRQNPFGWIQSTQNKFRWLPRNGLYAMLHHRSSDLKKPFSQLLRLQLWFCFAVLAPPALVLSIFAACVRSGATIHMVFQKPLNRADRATRPSAPTPPRD